FTVETDGCCRPPNTLNFNNISSSGLQIGWNSITAAVNFEVRYRPVGSSDWAENSVSGTSTFISDLLPCTEYEFEIRSNCDTSLSDYGMTQIIRTIGCGTCLDAEYCVPNSRDNTEEWIAEVNFGNLFVNPTSQAQEAYENYGELVGSTVARGAVYPISLLPGYAGASFSESFEVFVDWNQDGIFLSNERVVQISSSGETVIASIPVPETAALGLTRMRVIMEFISVSGSCTNTRNGETEDYCLRIIENPGCVAPNWIQAEYFTEDEMVILTWAASAGPGGEYLVRYRPLESTEWTEITTTELSLILSDFPLCELYEVEIASLCDDEPGAFLRTVFNSCSSTSTPNYS
ncbi:MAG: GEVED domain-containing protein, partial [Bacteroidota bacterium]